MGRLELTIIVFYIIFFSLIIFPISYWKMNNKMLMRIESKSLFGDWRFLVPCFIYVILLGYRYDYAFDWTQYQLTFKYIQAGRLYREDTEVGYLAINRLLGLLGGDYYSIFLLEGFLWFFSICYLVKDNRKSWIFVLLMVYIAHRFRCLNLSRQHLAMSLIFIGYAGLWYGKRKWYWVWGILACTVHSSCILYIFPFYLSERYVNKLKLPNRKLILVLYVTSVIFSEIFQNYIFQAGDFITKYLISNKNYTVDTLTNERFQFDEEPIVRTIIWAIKDIGYILLFYCLNKMKPFCKKEYVFLFIGLMSIFFRVWAGRNEITSRVFIYIVVFYNIGWGILLTNLCYKWKKVPFYITICAIIAFVHTLYSLLPTIVEEVMKDIYIEYRPEVFLYHLFN